MTLRKIYGRQPHCFRIIWLTLVRFLQKTRAYLLLVKRSSSLKIKKIYKERRQWIKVFEVVLHPTKDSELYTFFQKMFLQVHTACQLERFSLKTNYICFYHRDFEFWKQRYASVSSVLNVSICFTIGPTLLLFNTIFIALYSVHDVFYIELCCFWKVVTLHYVVKTKYDLLTNMWTIIYCHLNKDNKKFFQKKWLCVIQKSN